MPFFSPRELESDGDGPSPMMIASVEDGLGFAEKSTKYRNRLSSAGRPPQSRSFANSHSDTGNDSHHTGISTNPETLSAQQQG